MKERLISRHTQHNNGYLREIRKVRRRDGHYTHTRLVQSPAKQRAAALELMSRFDRLGWHAAWGEGDDKKGHGYWIYPCPVGNGRTITKGAVRRTRLLAGHFNGGNTNPYFQMHGEAVRILRRLEARPAK